MTPCSRCTVLPGQIVYTADHSDRLLCWPCFMDTLAHDRPALARQPQECRGDLIGHRVEEPCPLCGHRLLANRLGLAWCSVSWCDYRSSLAGARAENGRKRKQVDLYFQTVELLESSKE